MYLNILVDPNSMNISNFFRDFHAAQQLTEPFKEHTLEEYEFIYTFHIFVLIILNFILDVSLIGYKVFLCVQMILI